MSLDSAGMRCPAGALGLGSRSWLARRVEADRKEWAELSAAA